MSQIRNFLLAAATGLGLATAAHAGDMPAGAAAPADGGVEYVQWCDTMGAGFYMIPGTDTCLKIGGYVRTQWNYREQRDYGTFSGLANPQYDLKVFNRSRAKLNFDARTQTDYGVLRSLFDFQIEQNSPFQDGTNGGTETQVTAIKAAYITFAGFTAGLTNSWFGFNANEGLILFQRVSDPVPIPVMMAGYEMKFDQFKVGLSLEDNAGHALYIRDNSVSETKGSPTSKGGFSSEDNNYGPAEYPDVVGRILYEGGWGTAQLSAAYHNISYDNAAQEFDNNGDATYNKTDLNPSADDVAGFAVQGAVKILLPMIEAGDFLNLHAAYADGAIRYLGYDPGENRLSLTSGSVRAMYASTVVADANYNGLTNELETSTGYTLAANFRHFWSPGYLRSNLAVSYTDVDQSDFANTHKTDGTSKSPVVSPSLRDFTEVVANANLVWTPSRALQVGAEVQYRNLDTSGVVDVPSKTANKTSDDEWAARFTIQRDF